MHNQKPQGNDIGQFQTVHFYIAIKSIEDIGIGDVELFRNGGGGSRQVAECVDNQHICSIRVALAFINKVERFIGRVKAVRICTAPSSLLKLQDQLIGILQDRMIDRAGLDSSGMHSETADRTEPDPGMRFNGEAHNTGQPDKPDESVYTDCQHGEAKGDTDYAEDR